jgi:hypothetical protein
MQPRTLRLTDPVEALAVEQASPSCGNYAKLVKPRRQDRCSPKPRSWPWPKEAN